MRKKIKDGDDEYKSKWLALIRKDFVSFIEYFGWTYDPRRKPMDFPFILYEFQKQFAKDLIYADTNQKDLLIEKSRDMGVSWISLYFILWKFLFAERATMLLGSNKEDNVDKKGDIKTLMEKIRYALNRLPRWVLPDKWGEDNMQFLKIIHPNGNLISGESANKNFSMGGRFGFIFMDEFASWDYDEEVWRVTADAAAFRILVSTPKGVSNEFARLKHAGDIKVVTYHWTQHPLKNQNCFYLEKGKKVSISPEEATKKWEENRSESTVSSDWYEEEKHRRDNKNRAQELDIVYNVVTGLSVFCKGYEIKADFTPKDKPKDEIERFAIGVDCASGTGLDWNVATVVNKETMKQVKTLRTKNPLDIFAIDVARLGEEWNNALVAPEINGLGIAFVQKIKGIYKYLYYRKDWDRASNRIVPKLGWQTNRKTKELLIQDLDEALRYGLEVSDRTTLDELKVMEYDENGSANAPQGMHDDTCIALGLAIQALKDVRRPIREDREEYFKEKRKKRYIGTRKRNMITGKLL